MNMSRRTQKGDLDTPREGLFLSRISGQCGRGQRKTPAGQGLAGESEEAFGTQVEEGHHSLYSAGSTPRLLIRLPDKARSLYPAICSLTEDVTN